MQRKVFANLKFINIHFCILYLCKFRIFINLATKDEPQGQGNSCILPFFALFAALREIYGSAQELEISLVRIGRRPSIPWMLPFFAAWRGIYGFLFTLCPLAAWREAVGFQGCRISSSRWMRGGRSYLRISQRMSKSTTSLGVGIKILGFRQHLIAEITA